MSALRSAANAKPVVVLKAGRKPAGNAAAQTHSGAIVGSDDVFDAALRRAGAVRVRSFVELFSAAKCLASRYRPVGRRLAIVTNGGGPGVLAADWVNEIGLQLGRLSTRVAGRRCGRSCPQLPSLTDLIDLSEDAGAAHYRAAIEAAGRDRAVDGVLAIHSPKAGVDAAAVARALVDAQRRPWASRCWPAGWATPRCGAARELLNEAAHPELPHARGGGRRLRQHRHLLPNQQLLQQTPPPLSRAGQARHRRRAPADRERARRAPQGADRDGVARRCCRAFHIPVTQHHAGAQRQRGDDDRHAARLPGGAEDRFARHQPQVRRAGRGAEHHERRQRARHLHTSMVRARGAAAAAARASTA